MQPCLNCLSFIAFSALIGMTSPLLVTASPLQATEGVGQTLNKQGTQADANQFFQAGQQFYRKGEIKSALEQYQKALTIWQTLKERQKEAETLNRIAESLLWQGRSLEALKILNQALEINKAISYENGVGETLTILGHAYQAMRDYPKAQATLEQALAIHRALGNKIYEGKTLNILGDIYNAQKQYSKALELFKQALPLRRLAQDSSEEADTLGSLGDLYLNQGQNTQGLQYYQQALKLLQSSGGSPLESLILNDIGGVYYALGDKQKALDYYSQSLPLLRAVGNRDGESAILNNLGGVYSDLGDKQKALEYYNQSLPLSRAVGDHAGEATTLNNIGVVYYALGDKQKALDYYSQSLPLSRAVGDHTQEAKTLNNIGAVYTDLGDKQKALEHFNQSLPLSRAVGDHAVEASTLNNIGGVYTDLGDKQKALEHFNQSLPLSRAVGDHAVEAATLNNIGQVYSDLGDKQKALEHFNQSLPLSRAVGDHAVEATILNNIGQVYDALGDKQKALDYYNQSLPLSHAVGRRALEAKTLNNIGNAYYALGDKQKVLGYYNASLLLSRAVGDHAVEATTLFNLAILERSQGNPNQALIQIQAALEIINDLRTKVVNKELRASYFETVQDYYEFYIDLLMQLHKQQPLKGYDALALKASETRRARGLLDLLSEAHADIRQGVDPKLVEQERDLQQQINAKEASRQKLLSDPKTSAQATALQQDINALLNQYGQVQAQIRVKSPGYAKLTQPQPLTLSEIQNQVLDNNTLLLEYSLGKDRSYLWAVTKAGISSYELPKQADIEDLAKQFYTLVQQTTSTQAQSNPDGNRRGLKVLPNLAKLSNVASKLSQILLQPIAQQLGQKRLLIVGDGALQYVPFSALPNPVQSQTAPPNTPLLAEHEIVALPSASTLAILRSEFNQRQPAPKALAVLADPVFSAEDERLTQKRTNPTQSANLSLQSQQISRSEREEGVTWPRLKYTRTEAERILALVPSDSDRTQAFDFQANLQQALNPTLAQYRMVHFATHGFLDSVHPELSGVVLSLMDRQGQVQDGFLRLNEIFNLKLPAELVVLSACETGLGKQIRGEGLVGLTRGFMYAGAKRVAVSLWSVPDQGTEELMSRFYKKMIQDKMPPAAALRAAQLELWRDPKWKDPYNWAAFEVQGEWK